MTDYEIPDTVGCVFEITDKSGVQWKADCMADCEENAGGLYIELYRWDDEYGLNGDYYDTMCIFPDETDLNNEKDVEEYISDYINLWYV